MMNNHRNINALLYQLSLNRRVVARTQLLPSISIKTLSCNGEQVTSRETGLIGRNVFYVNDEPESKFPYTVTIKLYCIVYCIVGSCGQPSKRVLMLLLLNYRMCSSRSGELDIRKEISQAGSCGGQPSKAVLI